MLGNGGIVVAVSGGPDSVALLDILTRLVALEGERHAVLEPRSIHIAHLDHMLRPFESADDAEFVRGLAQGLGISVTVHAVDVRAAAKLALRGIEETARGIRYNFLAGVARDLGYGRVAVGHTMTDQAETVLMRLIRGAGLKGLAAMRPVSVVPASPESDAEVGDGRRRHGAGSPLLIRPLLCVTREEIESYCRERNLDFRTDPTNLAAHFTRNRIRREILPALNDINPRAIHAIARAAENAAADQDALDAVALSALEEARVCPAAELLSFGRDAEAYSAAALVGQPPGVRRRAIIEAIRRTRPSDAREVTSKHILAVEALLESGSSGKRVTLPGSLEVWREFDTIVFKPVPQYSGITRFQNEIGVGRPRAEAGGLAITLQRGVRAGELESVVAENRKERQRSGRDWMVVALDDRLVPERLVIRPRVEGQSAHVVGQTKTKKLKNLMIDHRIPTSRRAEWPVVTTPDGGYVWSPGLPPSLKFIATSETESLAVLRASFI